MILLTQEAAKIQPMGYVLIIGFLVAFIFGVIYDKKRVKQFNEEIIKKFEGKIVDGAYGVFITDDNELIMRFEGYGFSGYKVFALNEVAYVMTAWDDYNNQWVFGLYNDKKKTIKGQEFMSSRRKPRKAKAYFYTPQEAIELWECVHKKVPKAKHVGKYFKDTEE